MDRKTIFKRVLWNLAHSPLVALPIGFGAVTWALSSAFGAPFGFFGYLGISGILLGMGTALTRLFVSREDLSRAAMEDLLNEGELAHERYLKQLGRKLRRDKDRRTNQFLEELGRQRERLQSSEIMQKGVRAQMLPEIKSAAEQLYQSCLNSLERSLAFYKAANQMATKEAADELLDSREQLLKDVEGSIQQLGRTLDRLQTAALKRDQTEDLAQIRQELETGLEVAQRVEERMGQIEKGLDIDRGVSHPVRDT